MPKIIENLRQTLLSAARTLLLREGYAALTIRRVAAISGIAVGTVYNYFPSKELLAAAVMLWCSDKARNSLSCRNVAFIVLYL